MQQVFGVEFINGGRRALRQFPERLPVFGFRVDGVRIHQLQHVVAEVFVELLNGCHDAVVEVSWLLLKKFVAFIQGLDFRIVGFVLLIENLNECLGP